MYIIDINDMSASTNSFFINLSLITIVWLYVVNKVLFLKNNKSQHHVIYVLFGCYFTPFSKQSNQKESHLPQQQKLCVTLI